MEPTASPLMSLMPLAAMAPDGEPGLEKPQNMLVNAENGATETSGLFASILSELIPDEALPAPLMPETAVSLPATAQGFAAEGLPPGGNVLPLPVQPVILAADIRPVNLASEMPAETTEQSELLALAELLQPALNPVITATVAANQPAATAPVIAAVVSNPASSKPMPQPAAAITQATVIEPVIVDEPLPTAAVTTTKDIRVEGLDKAINQALANQQPAQSGQPVQTVAPDGTAALTGANPTTSQPAAGTTPSQPTFILDRPMGDARWGESLGQRIVWMSENGMGRAEIRLNPPELGPLNVRVTVANDEARVAFNVQHGTTREMVEAALPRLREMFANQGIELTDASVSQHSPGDRGQTADMGDTADRSGYGNAQADTAIEDVDEFTGRTTVHDGLIDTYV